MLLLTLSGRQGVHSSHFLYQEVREQREAGKQYKRESRKPKPSAWGYPLMLKRNHRPTLGLQKICITRALPDRQTRKVSGPLELISDGLETGKENLFITFRESMENENREAHRESWLTH